MLQQKLHSFQLFQLHCQMQRCSSWECGIFCFSFAQTLPVGWASVPAYEKKAIKIGDLQLPTGKTFSTQAQKGSNAEAKWNDWSPIHDSLSHPNKRTSALDLLDWSHGLGCLHAWMILTKQNQSIMSWADICYRIGKNYVLVYVVCIYYNSYYIYTLFI